MPSVTLIVIARIGVIDSSFDFPDEAGYVVEDTNPRLSAVIAATAVLAAIGIEASVAKASVAVVGVVEAGIGVAAEFAVFGGEGDKGVVVIRVKVTTFTIGVRPIVGIKAAGVVAAAGDASVVECGASGVGLKGC